MTTKENIPLIGFYHQIPVRLDGDILDWFKYDDQNEETDNYLRTCTIQDFIYVIVTLFKDQYPDAAAFSFHISENYKREESVPNYRVTLGKPKHRADIAEFKWHYSLSPEIAGDYYLTKLEIIFAKRENRQDLLDAILEALMDNIFTNGPGEIAVKNSPISSIKLTERAFELVVNKDMIVYY